MRTWLKIMAVSLVVVAWYRPVSAANWKATSGHKCFTNTPLDDVVDGKVARAFRTTVHCSLLRDNETGALSSVYVSLGKTNINPTLCRIVMNSNTSGSAYWGPINGTQVVGTSRLSLGAPVSIAYGQWVVECELYPDVDTVRMIEWQEP